MQPLTSGETRLKTQLRFTVVSIFSHHVPQLKVFAVFKELFKPPVICVRISG